MQCTYVFIRASAQLCAIHKLIHGGDETDGFIYSEGIDSGHCYKCVTMRVCVYVVVVVFSDKSLLACRTVSPHLCKRTPEGNRFICKRTILLPLLPPTPTTHTHTKTQAHIPSPSPLSLSLPLLPPTAWRWMAHVPFV